jgi:predicted TPR repeat methyltransferase
MTSEEKPYKIVPVMRDVQDIFSEAFTLHRAGDLAGAERLYRDALGQNPRHAESLHFLGLISCQSGRHEEGATLIAQAIAVKGDAASWHYNLGSVLQSLHRAQEAAACYTQAVSLKPDYAEAHNNLGILSHDQGRLDEAAAHLRRAIAAKPEFAEPHYHLGTVLKAQGKAAEAAEHFRHCLALDPQDRHGAALLLAAAEGKALPPRASEAHMQKLYTHRARFWDKGPSAEDPYKAHALVADALGRFWTSSQRPDVLDAGCGTGLVGQLLRERAARLEGVDLSPAMLEQAAAKNVYDALHHVDLVAFLEARPAAFDAIACAATLIHFGDLRPALCAVATALRPDGLFAATLFPGGNDAGITDAPYPGCYAHGRTYIKGAAQDSGLKLETLEDAVHEYNQGAPVTGLVLVLRK